MKTLIVITLEVEGTHNWPQCPFEDVAFLKSEHRHMFRIRAEKEVSHEDREIEIILMKRKVTAFLQDKFGTPCKFGSKSCETIARELAEKFGFILVEVLEDGENGALVIQ